MSEAETDANSVDRLQLSLPSWTVSAVGWLLCACAVFTAIFVGLKLNERYGWIGNGKHNAQRIAVVDVEAVLEPYRRDFVSAMSVTKLSDAEREVANDSVRKASVAVGIAVKAIASECECALFVRSAVFNPEALDDHTDLLAVRTSALLNKVPTAKSADQAASATVKDKP